MKKYDLAVFDLDGTVLDTTEGVLAAVKYTIQEFGLEMPSEGKLRSFIGPPIQESFAKEYNLSDDVIEKMAETFRERYKNFELFRASPYKNIYDLLRQLKRNGIESAIATYKRESYALPLLSHYHFNDYMISMHGSDDANQLRKQDIIQLCIGDAEILDVRRVVMIGDTVHDAVGAEKIGADFIGVTYGFGFKSKEEAKTIKTIGFCDTPLEIMKLVQD